MPGSQGSPDRQHGVVATSQLRVARGERRRDPCEDFSPAAAPSSSRGLRRRPLGTRPRGPAFASVLALGGAPCRWRPLGARALGGGGQPPQRRVSCGACCRRLGALSMSWSRVQRQEEAPGISACIGLSACSRRSVTVRHRIPSPLRPAPLRISVATWQRDGPAALLSRELRKAVRQADVLGLPIEDDERSRSHPE